MKYIDKDGDVWESLDGDMMRIVRSDFPTHIGVEEPKNFVERHYGPIRLVDESPLVLGLARTIRDEVANILQELADSAYDEFRWREGAEADACYRMHELFEQKAKAIKAEVHA